MVDSAEEKAGGFRPFRCRSNRYFAIFLAIVFLATNDCVLAAGEYQIGVDLYGKRRYAEAAPYFEAASLASPSNAAANYYAGYSFYLAGKRAESCKSLWRLVRNNPAAKEASDARTILKQIDPDYFKNDELAVGKAVAPNVPGIAGVPGAPGIAVAASTRAPSAEVVIASLINVRRAKGKLSNVTPEFVDKVKRMLSTVPVPILVFLRDHGCTVVLAPAIVENDMRIQNTVPRGWDIDRDWKNSPALTHGKEVQVGQFRLDPRTGDYVDTTAEMGVVRHELGHALDHCLGNFSESEEFKHPYLLDVGTVPAEYSTKLHYYLQKAGSGPSETFAELFCYYVGGETENRVEVCDLTHKCFPQAERAMLNKLKAIQN